MSSLGLNLLNLSRWLRAYFFEWVLLGLIYSLSAGVLLQSVLMSVLKIEIGIFPVSIGLGLLLMIPAIIEKAVPGGIPMNLPFYSKSSFSSIYFAHETRRCSTWLAVFLSAFIIHFIPHEQRAFSILIALTPCLRALYSISHWRRIAVIYSSKRGGGDLIRALWFSQTAQSIVLWSIVSVMGLRLDIFLILAGWGAVLAAASVALEGDSGRPWLVHLLSVSSGLLGGYLTVASPWALLGIFYFASKMKELAQSRLLSVEHYDEDFVIS